MMSLTVYAIDGIVPVVDPTAFVHPSAVLIGDVVVGPGCYIGPLASLRGDFGAIRIGAGANVQDCCVLHAFPREEVVIDTDGHIGHGAILHGCRIGRNALVGMNAVLMDGVTIGENSIVAAQSFVKAGETIPPGSLAAGTPARVLRPVTEDEIAWKSAGTAEYQRLTRRCHASLVACAPLAAVEPNRGSVDCGPLQPLHQTR
ncbi:transferase hexapeptide repeat family protein [Magnetospirillum fulvum]